jgi:pimeloyl-ACP methyl ester carboxylesterase
VTFLLLPGLGSNGLVFPTAFMQALLQLPGVARVVAVTYALPFPSIDGAAEAVWASVPFVVSGPASIVLVGYSMGGFVAQAMAANPPLPALHRLTVAGVVLLSTACAGSRALALPLAEVALSLGHVTSPMASLFPDDWLAAVTLSTLKSLTQVLKASKVSAAARSEEYAAVVHFFFSGYGGAADYGKSCVLHVGGAPVLAIHGTLDRVLKASSMADAVAASSGATYVPFEGAGHGLLFQDTQGVLRAIGDWYRKLPAQPHGPTGATKCTSRVPMQAPAVFYLTGPGKGASPGGS